MYFDGKKYTKDIQTHARGIIGWFGRRFFFRSLATDDNKRLWFINAFVWWYEFPLEHLGDLIFIKIFGMTWVLLLLMFELVVCIPMKLIISILWGCAQLLFGTPCYLKFGKRPRYDAIRV